MHCYKCFYNQAICKIVWPLGEETPLCAKCRKKFIDPVLSLFPQSVRICGLHEKVSVEQNITNTVTEVTPKKNNFITPYQATVNLKKKTEEELSVAIKNEEYEKAAKLRDKIKSLNELLKSEKNENKTIG